MNDRLQEVYKEETTLNLADPSPGVSCVALDELFYRATIVSQSESDENAVNVFFRRLWQYRKS